VSRPRINQTVPELEISSGVRALLNGLGGSPIGTRERMVLLAIEQIVERGPVDFNSGLVCDQLGIKHPMIKHYFGSKENLLSEALLWVFRDWSRVILDAISSPMTSPDDLLKKKIKAEVEWGRSMKSMAILSHYPMVSDNAKRIISISHSSEMQRLFEFHLAALTSLIVAIRAKVPFTLNFDAGNYPRAELVIKHPQAFLAATSISWSTHGLVVWSSGDHLSTRGFINETAAGLSAKIAIENHLKVILKIAKG
jgi:AcrR family transcriptional regulator